MRILGAACALVLIGTGAALAQAPPSPAPAALPPATPEQIAKAKAFADQLISQARAEAYFENVTTGAVAEVRHLPSGVVCKFSPSAPGVIRVYQSRSLPGEDVSCGYQEAGATFTLYISRYPQTPTLTQELRSMVASVQAATPGVKKAEGSYALAAIGQGQTPPHDAVRMEYTRDGKRIFTRAAASIVGDWVIDQRVTGPFEDAFKTDMLSELSFVMTVTEAAKVKPDPARLAALEASSQDAASDEAKRLIRGQSSAAGLVNVTAQGVPLVRHQASGLTCRFSREAAGNRLTAIGDGLICATVRNFGVETVQLVRMPGATDQKAAGLFDAFVKDQYKDAEPLSGIADAKTDPPHVTRRMIATQKDGSKVFVRLSYAIVGDWLILQRFNARAISPPTLDLDAEQLMVGYVKDLADHQAAAPTVAAKRP